VKGIIGLPANLFYGTGIPACIVVIDKEDAPARKGIFMIDASAGYIKDGPKNRLRDQDIHKIVDVFNKQAEVPKYSRMVSFGEIEKNEFNLNLPRYIDSQEAEDLQDIEGHLHGGIPQADIDALERFWRVCPGLKSALFKLNRPGYLDLAIDKSQIRTTIFKHPEFVSFVEEMNRHFEEWREKASKKLKELAPGCHPKEVVAELSESLLAHYQNKPLIDPYDIYQHLMNYWAEVMQDDCYIIAADGWVAEPTRIIETAKNGKAKDKGWECELLPKNIVIGRYFAAQQVAVESLAAQLQDLSSKLAEIEEEHGGDEGLLSAIEKVNKINVAARLKELKSDGESSDESILLAEWLRINSSETEVKKKVKDSETALDARVYERYGLLSEADVKLMVVEDKWLGELKVSSGSEIERVSQSLATRLKVLAERYEYMLPSLTAQVRDLEMRVSEHLTKMGFSWN
jgi:type I restriction enzyme M protein